MAATKYDKLGDSTHFQPIPKEGEKNENKMLTVNLSSVELTASDISVLEKGLTFIPTPKTLPIKSLLENKDRLIRNIKIKSFFQNSNKSFDPKLKTFQERSTWTPKLSCLSSDIIETIKEIEDTTIKLIKQTKKIQHNNESELKLYEVDNLNREEHNSIIKLRNNDKILIKCADKGGATVIMDKENYIFEAYRQLNDIKYYTPLQQPIFHENIPRIKNVLENMKREGCINQKQFEFLSGP